MDIEKIVAWIHATSFVVAFIIFVARILTGKTPMHPMLRRVLTSNGAIGVLIGLGLVASGLSFYLNMHKPIWPTDFRNLSLERIRFQTFENEEVVLDGKEIENCRFRNVTFVFHGTKPFILSHNDVDAGGGNLKVKISTGPQYTGALLLYGLYHDACLNKNNGRDCPHLELSEIPSIQ
jgi:hypothetical protein